MTEPIDLDDLTPERAWSRRNVLLGAGAAALGAAAAMSASSSVDAASPHPDALGAAVTGLQYMALDAIDFWPDGFYSGSTRYLQALTGAGILSPPGQLAANIPLPTGSVIRQISVAYQGTPLLSIWAKPLADPVNPVAFVSTTLAAGGGNKTQTLNLNGATPQLTPVAMTANRSDTMRFFLNAGDSVHAATIGYTTRLQGFVPVSSHQRVLDTRSSGGKLLPGQVRTVSAGAKGARSTMFSLVVLGTEGTGSVACYGANVAYPGNSSITWFGSNQTLENTVVCPVDANGAIKIRGGSNRTHVIIDRIGHFY